MSSDWRGCLRSATSTWWEDGTFGIDATFQGATGYRHAEFHEAILHLRDIRCTLRQELDGGWTIRLGPLPRPLVEQAIALFIGAR